MCEERSFDYEFETDTPILMEMQKNRYEKFKFVFFFWSSQIVFLVLQWKKIILDHFYHGNVPALTCRLYVKTSSKI